MFEILITLALTFAPGSYAENGGGGCEETSCLQSHVSTTGENIFFVGCTAHYTNTQCTGKPISVFTNRCLSVDEIETSVAGTPQGETLLPGACGARRMVVQVSCDEACAAKGYLTGTCVRRSVSCFGSWRTSSYCRCLNEPIPFQSLDLP